MFWGFLNFWTMKKRPETEKGIDVMTNWCLLNLRTHIFLYLPKKDRTDFHIKYTKSLFAYTQNMYLIRKKCVFVLLGHLRGPISPHVAAYFIPLLTYIKLNLF
jgi:hypothetical protein